MSVIQSIRTKYAKLAGFVIALALVAFILMDAASSRLGSFFGNDSSVAKVNGHKIDYKEYSQRTADYDILYGYSASGRVLDDQTRAQLNQQALSDLISEQLIKEEAELLGLETTTEEAKELIYGANPDPAVKNYAAFKNQETGMFDPQYVRLFEEQIDQLDPSGKAKQQWEILKAYVIRNNIINKYNALLTKNVYVPNFMVEKQVKDQGQKASINYVSIGHNDVGDEEIKVTDDELLAYMKKNKNEYAAKDNSRGIEYVSFDVLPTAADTATAREPLNVIVEDFRNTDDPETFVNRNSDAAYDSKYVMKKDFRSLYADSIMSLPVGGVFGPYLENGEYKLTKVTDRKSFPDSVTCRHILIKTADGNNLLRADSVAKQKIDSIVAEIKKGTSFAELVKTESDDVGSKETNGEYTFQFQQRPNLSKEFGDFIFEDGKKGKSKIVKVENASYSGYHYIEVLNQKNFNPASKLATITKILFAGDETENNVYAEASSFAGNNNTAEAFDKALNEGKYNKRIADGVKVNDFIIPGIGSSRELIRWMYNAKVGDVSHVFQMKNRYVVAKLTDVVKEGSIALNRNNRSEVENRVMREKKKQMIIEKYSGKGSLQEIANAANKTVASADSFSAATSFIAELGFEPKVSGYAFNPSFEKNTISPPIQGQGGIFFITLKDRFNVEANVDDAMIKRQKEMMQQQAQGKVNGQLQELLKKKADVKYNGDNI